MRATQSNECSRRGHQLLPRLGSSLIALTLVAAVAACGGQTGQAPPEQAPQESQSSKATEPSQAPSSTASQGQQPPGSSGQTDPMKLDAALLKPEQLPGWQPGEPVGAYTESTIEPQACKAFHQATLEKVASDMGSTVAYQQDDKSVQEYLDLVNKGTQTLTDLEQQLGQCGEYTVSGEGVKEPVQVEKIEAPQLGEKTLAVRLVSNLDGQVENQVVWVAQGDVVLMVRLEGDKLDETTLPDVVTKAHQQLQASL